MGRTTTIYGSLEPVWGTKIREGEVRRCAPSISRDWPLLLSPHQTVCLREHFPVYLFQTSEYDLSRQRTDTFPLNLHVGRTSVMPFILAGEPHYRASC